MMFKTILVTIGSVLKKENLPYILAVTMFIMAAGWMNSCNKRKVIKAEKEVLEQLSGQNMKAIADSITVIRNKMDDNEFSKATFVQELDDIKKYNKDIYEEIRAVKGDVISYIDSKLDVEIPKLEVDNELVKYDDTRYGLMFDVLYQDPGFKLNVIGVSQFKFHNNTILPSRTIFDSTSISLDIKYGFRDLDDTYEVFAISQSPLIKINHLNGHMIIDKSAFNSLSPVTKAKKFGVGIQSGAYYVPFYNKVQFGVGIGISYNIFRF